MPSFPTERRASRPRHDASQFSPDAIQSRQFEVSGGPGDGVVGFFFLGSRLVRVDWIDETALDALWRGEPDQDAVDQLILPQYRCGFLLSDGGQIGAAGEDRPFEVHCTGFLRAPTALYAAGEYTLLLHDLASDLLRAPPSADLSCRFLAEAEAGTPLGTLVRLVLADPAFAEIDWTGAFPKIGLSALRMSRAGSGGAEDFDTVLLSHERMPKSPFGDRSDGSWGGAHYSYSIVASRFARMFRMQGRRVEDMRFPGIYKAPIGRALLRRRLEKTGSRSGAIHFIVKPIELVELMPGERNLMHYAWEFQTLTTAPLDWDVRRDQVAQLKMLDGILVPSQHIVEVLGAYGIETARLQPTPVVDLAEVGRAERAPLNTLGELSGVVEDGKGGLACVALAEHLRNAKRILLTVSTPVDRRKNLAEMVRGFHAAKLDDAVLVVKLTADPAHFNLADFVGQLSDPHEGGAGRVVYILDRLPEAMLTALYRVCHAYLSTSRGEGQNLPILEAMAQGMMPVAPDHSAMADYISPQTGVVIESVAVRAPRDSNYTRSANHRFWGVSRDAVASALHELRDLAEQEVVLRAGAALDVVRTSYTTERCAELLIRNIEDLS